MEAINWHSVFFYLFAALACGAAAAVVLCGNIVRMAFALVAALGAVAGLFFLAGADFLGALQLLVYVGGTMVLLVFGVMLTSHSPLFALRSGAGHWIAAVVIGACLLTVLLRAALAANAWASPPLPQQLPPRLQPTTSQIGLALLGVRTDKLDRPDPVLQKGMCGYLLPFEIASVHLLVVLIGAMFLARTKRRMAATGSGSNSSQSIPRQLEIGNANRPHDAQNPTCTPPGE